MRSFLAALAAGVSVFAQAPWNAAPFSVQPQELIRAANAVQLPAGADSVVFAENLSYSFDDRGRETRTVHRIYKVLDPAAVEAWSDVEVRWEPWHEQRPTMRARVIAPDGRVTQLDTRTIAELPVGKSGGTVSDARILHAPLPAVAAGSIVEDETRVAETEPIAAAGTVSRAYLGYFDTPAIFSSVTISAPRAVKLQAVTRLLPQAVTERSEAGGRTQIRVTQGRMEGLDDYESYLPFDVPRGPHVEFSTAASWEAVAGAYHRLSDPQVRPAEVQALVASANLAGKSRAEVASILLKLLHDRVRYTGLEFAEAAIVPRSPREVLERQYGDCKDQAALLVAMLRAAGIQAHLALLSSGFGQDVTPELPGFGLFDHAIVYAPGEPDLWADPTDPFSRFNELPSGDQGRWALISREGGTLVRIPEAPPQSNLILETREFYLTERGPARVIEITEPRGFIESGYRSSYGNAENADTKESLARYAKSRYSAEGDPVLTFTPAANLDVPYRMTIEMAKAGRGETADIDAVVAVPIGDLFERLPDEFLDDPDEDSKPRQGDLVLPTPFVNEWRYKIVPPPGFRVAPLPENQNEKWGPATLETDFRSETDGSVSARFRFDVGKRRYSAAEVATVGKKVRELREGPAILVRFLQIGEELVASGKIREGLAEFNRLRALHPDEGRHREQLARALLTAGVGDAAREEIRAAVAASPNDAATQRILAWVLQHDSIGRRFGKGSDLEGAAAAYRKALEIEPAHADTLFNLGILLEHMPDGRRYESKEKMLEAIQAYRGIKEDESETIQNNLIIDLLRTEQYEAAEQEARKQSTAAANALLLVAIAGRRGSQAAIAEAARLRGTDQDRRNALSTAGQTLVTFRMYALGADLLEAGAQGTAQAAAVRQRVDMLRSTKRFDAGQTAATPEDVLRRFFQLVMLPGTEVETIQALFSERSTITAGKILAEIASMGTLRAQMAQQGASMDLVSDLAISQMRINKDGDDATGYRMRIESLGLDQINRTIVFAVREGEAYKLLAVDDPEPLGSLALAHVERGEMDAARRLLDWAREIAQLGSGEDPLAGSGFARLWTRGAEANRDAMRYASAALIAGSSASLQAIPILQEGRAKAATNEARLAFDLSLVEAYVETEQWEPMLQIAEPLLAAYPRSERALAVVMAPLAGLKRWDRLDRVFEERLRLTPDDRDVLAFVATSALGRGQYARAIEIGKRLIADGRATSGDMNNTAWSALYEGPVTPEVIDIAQRGVRAGQSYGMLHTLAAVYAEAGMTTEARETLLQAMNVSGRDEPLESDWYVLGRIAEEYGLRDAARAGYTKLKPPPSEDAAAGSSWELVQRRLRAMGAGN